MSGFDRYNVKDGHTLHLVRGAAREAAPAPATPPPAQAPPAPTGGGAGLLGMDGLGAFQQQLMNNPALMQQMMDNPMVQNLMQNPEMMRQMMQMNPQTRALMEANPEIAQVWLLVTLFAPF